MIFDVAGSPKRKNPLAATPQALISALPDLPVADEEELTHTVGRDDFLRRIRAYHVRGACSGSSEPEHE